MQMKQKVVIVGVGLIGGSLALSLKRKHLAERVVGVSSPATLEKALELGVIDAGFPYDRLQEAIGGCDLLVLATPIHHIFTMLDTLSALQLPPGMIITDVGSTKSRVVEKAREVLPGSVSFIGGHPMAGSEKRGVQAVDPFLFQNALYVLCPVPSVPGRLCREFGDFLECIGARVMIMDAQAHDKNVSVISHLPQLLAVSLVCYAASRDEKGANLLQLAAGGFRDMTRIASSPFSMWKDIIESNRRSIRKTVEEYGAYLLDIAGDLEAEALKGLFDRAAFFRSGIPQDTKGFLKPLAELLVVVEDRPGVILAVSRPLADAGINIKDIEVLKVREGEGGTFRLAFEDDETSRKAMAVLRENGFEVRLRE